MPVVDCGYVRITVCIVSRRALRLLARVALSSCSALVYAQLVEIKLVNGEMESGWPVLVWRGLDT